MAESNSDIGNVTPNAELVQMAMSYSRSCTLCVIGSFPALNFLEAFFLPPAHIATVDHDVLVVADAIGAKRESFESHNFGPATVSVCHYSGVAAPQLL